MLLGQAVRRLPRAAPAAFFLLLALVLVGRLAYQVQVGVRRHRYTTEGVLRDYARLAAAEYARRMNMLDSYGCEPALRPVRRALETHSTVLRLAQYHFVLPLTATGSPGALSTYGADPAPAVRTWIADTLAAQCRASYRAGWDHALVFGSVHGETHALTYTVLRDSTGTPVHACGFEVRREALDYFFERAATF